MKLMLSEILEQGSTCRIDWLDSVAIDSNKSKRRNCPRLVLLFHKEEERTSKTSPTHKTQIKPGNERNVMACEASNPPTDTVRTPGATSLK
jgi:hypothetical protein